MGRLRLIQEQSTQMLALQAAKQLQLQIPQISTNIEPPKKNGFARKHVQQFAKRKLADILGLDADQTAVCEALETFMQEVGPVLPFDDLFFADGVFEQLFPEQRTQKRELAGSTYFGAASVGRPQTVVRAKMNEAVAAEKRLIGIGYGMDAACVAAINLSRILREHIGKILNIDPAYIVLTRNAAEAASLIATMAGVSEGREHLETRIAFSDQTQISMLVRTLLAGDAGNVDGRDPYSSIPECLRARGQQYASDEVPNWLRQNEFVLFAIRNKTVRQIQNEVERQLKPYSPDLVYVTHVDRIDGNKIPLEEVGDIIMDVCDQPTVVADGTLGFCNVNVDLGHLMCLGAPSKKASQLASIDAYISTLGKGAEGPSIGFAAISPNSGLWSEGIKKLRTATKDQVILHGMIDPGHAVDATRDEWLSLGELVGGIETLKHWMNSGRGIRPNAYGGGMNVDAFINKRKTSRDALREGLQEAFTHSTFGKDGIEFVPCKHEETMLILSVRIPSLDMCELVSRLQKKHGIIVQYMLANDSIKFGIERDLLLDRASFEDGWPDDPSKDEREFVSDAVPLIVKEAELMKQEGDFYTPVKKKKSKKES